MTIEFAPPVPARSTYVAPIPMTRLNGMPWASVTTHADLFLVKQWLADGLDLGILTVDQYEEADDTVFLFGDTGQVINFHLAGHR